MNCKRARYILTSDLINSLSNEEYLQLQLHLATCDTCRAYSVHIQEETDFISFALTKIADPYDLSPDFSAKLDARLRSSKSSVPISQPRCILSFQIFLRIREVVATAIIAAVLAVAFLARPCAPTRSIHVGRLAAINTRTSTDGSVSASIQSRTAVSVTPEYKEFDQ